METVEVQVDVVDAILALRDLAGRVSLAPARDELAAAIRGTFARVLETAGEYGGGPWEPLNERTMERYERERWGDAAIGEHTRGMWESLTDAGAPNAFEELAADGQELRVGTTDRVAVFFDRGTRRQPARPFFPDGELPPEVVERLEEIVARAIIGPLAG